MNQNQILPSTFSGNRQVPHLFEIRSAVSEMKHVYRQTYGNDVVIIPSVYVLGSINA